MTRLWGSDDWEEFAKGFFGEGNALDWGEIKSQSVADAIRESIAPWIESLQLDPRAFILPRVLETQEIVWYGCARSDRAFRQIREELVAFLGPSYSDFEGQPTVLDEADPVEAAVLRGFGTNAIRVRIPDRRTRKSVRERLLLWRKLVASRPPRTRRAPRPVGRIYREFEEALRSHDFLASEDLLNELRVQGHLDARNLRFLQILMLEAAQDWVSIIEHSDIGDLLEIRRPRRVTRALVRALYHVRLAGFEVRADPAGAVEEFEGIRTSHFVNLFCSRATLRCPEADASFMLFAGSSDPQRIAVRDAILQEVPGHAVHRPWVESLADSFSWEEVSGERPDTHDTDPSDLNKALAAYNFGDLDSAWTSGLALPSGLDKAVLLLRCAAEIGTLESARMALGEFDLVSDNERQKLLEISLIAKLHHNLRDFVSPAPEPVGVVSLVPGNWLEWVRGLQGRDGWPEAVVVAEAGASEWSLMELIEDSSQAEEFASIAINLKQPGHDHLLEGLPHLLRALLALDTPSPRLRPVYEALTICLLTDDAPGVGYFRTLADLVEARLLAGIAPADYYELLTDVGQVVLSHGAPVHFDAILDLVDILFEKPCPDAPSRQVFVDVIGGLFLRWSTRTDRIQLTVLHDLFGEVGLSLPDSLLSRLASFSKSPDDVEPRPLGGSRGVTVALYSLMGSVLKRVSKTIVESNTSVDVRTFNDKAGGSPALRKAAQDVDVFVVATAAATHAATIFISSNRPRDAVTLYPPGKGSASMLRALRDHFQKTQLSQ